MAKSSRPGRSSSGRKNDSSAKGLRKGRANQPRGSRRAAPSGGRSAKSPLARAQAIIDKGLESFDPQVTFDAASKALDISRDCATAWLALSEYAVDPRQSLVLCQQGVAAAERVLGRELFETAVGDFWFRPETRPYMQARAALADRLWSAGRRDESIEHLQEVLRLNPTDHQGCRYLLAARLIENGRDHEVAPLLNHYNEETTFWQFTKALAAFRREGNSPEAARLLRKAMRSNKHVASILLGKGLPRFPEAGAVLAGSAEEAADYVHDSGGSWRQTPGAITWFRETVVAAACDRKAPAKAAGPTPAVKSELLAIPQAFGLVWQAAIHRIASYLHESGQFIRPWSILIVSESERMIVAQQIAPARPSPEFVFDELARAMLQPIEGPAMRPSEIQVREDPLWETLRPHFEEIGVDIIYRPELDEADYAIRDMAGIFSRAGDEPGGLVDLKGVSIDDVADLFAAAADFYRSAPWRRVANETVIRIECEAFGARYPGPWYAVPMGQAGLTLGLAIYDNLDDLIELLESPGLAVVDSRQVATSLMFSEGFEIGPSDLAACVREDWDLAGPEAYPLVVRAAGDRHARPPLPWHLELMIACLRALPPFIDKHAPFDAPATETLSVKVASRDVSLTLSSGPEMLGDCCGDCESCGDDDCESCDEHCH